MKRQQKTQPEPAAGAISLHLAELDERLGELFGEMLAFESLIGPILAPAPPATIEEKSTGDVPYRVVDRLVEQINIVNQIVTHLRDMRERVQL